MGSRVFVRLYDGEQQRETDDVVLTLPPPPLKWNVVLSALVAALDRVDMDDEDDDEAGAAAAAAIAPERIANARLFLLPSESQGIVAELNTRGLRGIRENDQFVVCLHGEDYQQRVESTQATEAASTAAAAAGDSNVNTSHTLPQTPPLPSVVAVATKSEFVQSPFRAPHVATSSSTAAASTPTTTAPPPPGMGGFTSLGTAKGNKRYRSISGKMAAIKSLENKGLISADDRGHLKDLLLNNDSPQLQEALDQYNSTGDVGAVQAILTHELQNPSTKRAAVVSNGSSSNSNDWISDTLINDITMTFNTGNSRNDSIATVAALPANPFLYQSPSHNTNNNTNTNNSDATAYYNPQASMEASTDYSNQGGPLVYQQQQHGAAIHNMMSPAAYNTNAYAPPNMYNNSNSASLAQVNLPLRNRQIVHVGMKPSGFHTASTLPLVTSSTTPMDLRFHANYTTHNATLLPPPPMFATTSSPSGVPYALQQQQQQQQPYATASDFHTAMLQQQQQQQQQMYSMHRHSAYATTTTTPGSIVRSGIGGSGAYAYYAHNPINNSGYNTHPPHHRIGNSLALGGFDKHHALRSSAGKWTTAPPMPSYPPACSKEEKKEKIAKWLKKRETRNWSTKPSYPVRHSIAKSRKRGDDGRFITKARLAQMALDAAANGARVSINNGDSDVFVDGSSNGNSGNGSSVRGLQQEHGESNGAFDSYDPHMGMASLPAPTAVP